MSIRICFGFLIDRHFLQAFILILEKRERVQAWKRTMMPPTQSSPAIESAGRLQKPLNGFPFSSWRTAPNRTVLGVDDSWKSRSKVVAAGFAPSAVKSGRMEQNLVIPTSDLLRSSKLFARNHGPILMYE